MVKKKLLVNLKIYIAGHNGMVGRALHNHLNKLGVKKIITSSKKNLNLLDINNLKKFFKDKAT